MPVLQGDQPAGDIIGGLLGAAGAFIGYLVSIFLDIFVTHSHAESEN